jgi:hypothetical protein
MPKRFTYCNIAKQEEEYYSKIKQEYENDKDTYNEKKNKQSGNLTMSIGGASCNLIFFIIFLIIGIIFLKKKPEELPKKKKNKKKETIQKSNTNKPIGISLIIIATLCLLSIGLMAFFIMSTIKKQKELVQPIEPEEYDYKRPCYSSKQNKTIGEDEKDEEDNEEEEEDYRFLSGVTMPRLPNAAQKLLNSSRSNTNNNDSRGSDTSGNNAVKMSDVSGLTVTGSTVNNNSNKGGTFDAYSNDVQSGWDGTKDSSGDIVKSDGTDEGTTRETY